MVSKRHDAEATPVVPLSLWATTEDDLLSTELHIELPPADTFGRRTITDPQSPADR